MLQKSSFVSLTDEEYHSHHALSSGQLKSYIRSPAHYKADKERVNTQSDAQRIGSLIHKAVLEPHLFEEMIVPEPEHDLKTKAGREQTEAWAATLPEGSIIATSRDSTTSLVKYLGNRQLIKISELVMIEGIRQSCYKNELVSMYLNDSEKIVEKCGMGWISDIPVRIKPDLVSKGWLLDLKTTQNAHPDVFKWDIKRYQYDLQLEYYAMVIHQILGYYPEMGIIAVEKDKPHAISLFKIESSIKRQALIKAKCYQFKLDCETDNWPAYSPDFIQYDLDQEY